MLERFRAAKQAEIDGLLARQAKGDMPKPWSGTRPGFSDALKAKGKGAVIAEYKRASPSKGVINERLGPAQVAEAYRAGGAAAMSVLTEEAHFRGSLDYLFQAHEAAGAGLPLLRKDFLYHPVQVAATAATPASALLIIVRCFDSDQDLADMLAAADQAGIEAVTEVFDQADLDRARKAGARIIQVNNRDLDTLAVSLDVSRDMAKRMGQAGHEELWISASGVEDRATVQELAGLGFDAVLVGTWLMAGDDPESRLRGLTNI